MSQLFGDDAERLPPMVPPEEVARRQRQEDMKQFRKYLADTGAVKCLTKMYMHIYKNEMRMDNPMCVKDFLASFQAAAAEADGAVEENAALRSENAALLAQVEELGREVESLAAAKSGFSPDALYDELVSPGFWQAEVGEQPPTEAGITLGQLFRRLCGGSDCVALLAPPALQTKAADFPLPKDAFRMWVAQDLSGTERSWCKDVLLPKLAEAAGNPPFERELVDAIHESGLYPDRPEEVAAAVGLGDVGLQAFLEAVAAYCGGLAAAAEEPEDPPMPE